MHLTLNLALPGALVVSLVVVMVLLLAHAHRRYRLRPVRHRRVSETVAMSLLHSVWFTSDTMGILILSA